MRQKFLDDSLVRTEGFPSEGMHKVEIEATSGGKTVRKTQTFTFDSAKEGDPSKGGVCSCEQKQ